MSENGNDEDISITSDNTTIKFGMFLMEQAILEIEAFDINQDLLSDLLKLNLAVIHLMNALELLLKAILQGIGRDIYANRGETLNFYECLKSFSRNTIGIGQKGDKDFLPPTLLSAKNLYGIRNSIVHLGNLSSKFTLVPLFRDTLQFFQDSIEIYFPMYDQKLETILKKTPERIYTFDSIKVYDRYFARYLDYSSKGDYEIAIYSLYVATESLLREYVPPKVLDHIRSPSLTWLLKYFSDNFPDLIDNKRLEALYYFRSIRNKIVHGMEYDEEEIIEFLSKLAEVADIFEYIRTNISDFVKDGSK